MTELSELAVRDRNIFAYTAPGSSFPDYISINRRDGEIVVTVRGGHGGDLAEMKLPQAELDALIYALRGARINPLREDETHKAVAGRTSRMAEWRDYAEKLDEYIRKDGSAYALALSALIEVLEGAEIALGTR